MQKLELNPDQSKLITEIDLFAIDLVDQIDLTKSIKPPIDEYGQFLSTLTKYWNEQVSKAVQDVILTANQFLRTAQLNERVIDLMTDSFTEYLGPGLAGRSQVRDAVKNLITQSWTKGKDLAFAPSGLKWSWQLIDQRAVNHLTRDTMYWIGNQYGKNIGPKIAEITRKVGIESGLGRREVGKALRDAFEGELKIPVGFRGSPLNYYTLVGASAMNRSRTWGNITGYQERGIAYYRWEAALDERMCFPKGTKVLTDRKEKSIETIQPGWKVFTDQLRFKRVKAISKTKYKGQMNRIIAKNKKIECTSDHLIMIYRNDQIMWVEAKNIKRGDYLIKRKTGGKCKECGKEYHLQPLQNRKFSIERMNYCCQECYNKYRQRKNWTEITCKNCGKNKKVRKIYVDRNQYKCCSEKCRRNYELKGLKPEDLYQICKRCGKKYRAKPKEILNKTRSYCSEECYRPPQYLICKNCKIRFRYVPSEIVHRRFCSNGCYKSYTGETRFQKKVRKFIESKGVFIENEVQYNRFVVDFFLPIHQMAIEADGTYWHSKPGIKERDARKDKLLKDNGIQVIRISEECLERDLKKLGKILK